MFDEFRYEGTHDSHPIDGIFIVKLPRSYESSKFVPDRLFENSPYQYYTLVFASP